MSTTEIIQVNPVEYGIAENKATELIGNLPQIQGERKLLEQVYEQIVLLDIEDKETSKKAKELRLKIKDNRTKGIEFWHKTTKEFFLKGGQFVDAIKRKEVAVNERMEENLEGIEKYAENLEKERKAKLNAERVELLEPFDAFVPLGLNFGEISDEEFAKIFNGAKLQFEQQKKEEEEAEEKRIADAKIEAERIEKQRIENERLKAEADKREKEIEAERKKQAEIQAKKNNALAEEKALRAKRVEIIRPYLVLIRDYEKLISKPEVEFQKELKDLEKAAWEQHKYEVEKEQARLDDIAAKAKVEAELQAKKDADAKVEKERLAEEKRKQDEAKALAKAPIKKQLTVWVDDFKIAELNLENEKKTLIVQKFEAFKKWAKSEIESL